MNAAADQDQNRDESAAGIEFVPPVEWTADMLAALRRLRNEPETRRFLMTDHVIGEAEHRRWYESIRNDDRRLVFAVRRAGRVIGQASLTIHDAAAGRAEWGFHLAPALRGRGLARNMLAQFLDRAFARLGLATIEARVLDYNVASLALHRRLGFVEERRERGYRIRDGVARDCIHLALSREAWFRTRAGLSAGASAGHGT